MTGGLCFLEVRCDIERLSLALGLACPVHNYVRYEGSDQVTTYGVVYLRLVSNSTCPVSTKTTSQTSAKYGVFSHLTCSEAVLGFTAFV